MLHKYILLSVLSLISLNFTPVLYAQKSLFIGSIQFPSTLGLVPNIRIYYAGQKIVCETDDVAKKVIFSIPENSQRSFFYVLICPDIEFCSHENTIPFLKIKKNSSHKFFAMQRVPCEPKYKKKKDGPIHLDYCWMVKEIDLSLVEGRIPDDTIIICYHPNYIQAIDGGSMIEFPKIVMRSDIVKMAGSEAKLHDISNKWFLAALNTDTIHGTVSSETITNLQPKTVLAMLS